MGYRIVEIIEYGWNVHVHCQACGERSTRSLPHFLGAWRKYLNADLGELTTRLKCSCGAQDARTNIMGGSYAHFGMAGDAVNGRARWIRKTLTDAGLDPSAYGYPPLPAS